MAHAAAVTVASSRLSIETLRGTLLWLMGFAGAFVFIEPSPYEIMGALAIALFALTGLTLRAPLVPLILLLLLLNLGYATAMLLVIDQSKVVTWVLVSAYLAVTAVVYAAMLGANTQARLNWLMRGCLAAGLVASSVAIAAYFHLFGGLSDLFLLYGRARGTFNDPNVLGAFLVLPALIAFQRMLTGRLSSAVNASILLIVMLAALFLSFSRAAWGQFAFAAALLMVMSFATSRAPSERPRIALIAIPGTLVALGVAGESAIIDIDHWRHYFLILGALWGLMVVSRPALARPTAPA
jgi:hypothetical protein